MVERSCRTCTYCGKPIHENYNFMLDHATGFFGDNKDPTIVREGVFCSRSCLIHWLQKKEKEEAVCEYMQLRIKGFGAAFTKRQLEILNNISDKEWKEIRKAIVELGGTVTEPEAGEDKEAARQ